MIFKHLLEGRIADILAPVTGIFNQLYLAIQHHKNDEVEQILSNSSVDWNKSSDGVMALHVACRYNNRIALDLLLSKGVPINCNDSCGNYPLHTASKYGSIEICKFLVEKHCSSVQRNSQNQTPYDIAENHVIRQFLLPLQFQHEREKQENIFAGGNYAQNQMNSGPLYQNNFNENDYAENNNNSNFFSSNSNIYQNTSTGGLARYTNQPLNIQPNPSTHTPSPPPMVSSASLQSTIQESSRLDQNVSISALNVTDNGNQNLVKKPIKVAAAPAVIFKPDGFHSSSSDPKLQEFYGHKMESVRVAPPPIMPAHGHTQLNNSVPPPPPSYSMYASTGGPSYNRYVAYDYHAAVQQQQQPQQPQPRMPVPQQHPYPPPAPPPAHPNPPPLLGSQPPAALPSPYPIRNSHSSGALAVFLDPQHTPRTRSAPPEDLFDVVQLSPTSAPSPKSSS